MNFINRHWVSIVFLAVIVLFYFAVKSAAQAVNNLGNEVQNSATNIEQGISNFGSSVVQAADTVANAPATLATNLWNKLFRSSNDGSPAGGAGGSW